MKYLQIPENVTIPVGRPNAGTTFQFLTVVREVWLANSDIFGKGAKAVRTAVKIDTLFDGKNPGDWIAVEDADYTLFAQSVEGTQYNASISKYLIPFIDAVESASSIAP